MDIRVGVADHFGWAVVVSADAEHRVLDRRRVELVEPGVTPAPVHYDRRQSPPAAVAELVEAVRASVVRSATRAFDELAADLPGIIVSLSLRTWPDDFPEDIETLCRPPWEARADAVMYRRVLADLADERGWAVHRYEATSVERRAAEVLGERADEVLTGPRAALGPPWAKDHRTALAATVLAG